MAKKQYTTIRLDKEQHEQLAAMRKETGVPVSEQVRRAIREWLEKKDRERPESK